ncbi:MAG: hypothetical protein IRY87_21580 [Acetobacteraceae bacterium]|nr:hypothetical protein [Acetobacteraceae bacterium]
MAASASNGPVFLVKKLAGLVLLVLGVLLIALGLAEGSTWLTVLGVILAAGGAVLLALKIIQRNQAAPP